MKEQAGKGQPAVCETCMIRTCKNVSAKCRKDLLNDTFIVCRWVAKAGCIVLGPGIHTSILLPLSRESPELDFPLFGASVVLFHSLCVVCFSSMMFQFHRVRLCALQFIIILFHFILIQHLTFRPYATKQCRRGWMQSQEVVSVMFFLQLTSNPACHCRHCQLSLLCSAPPLALFNHRAMPLLLLHAGRGEGCCMSH